MPKFLKTTIRGFPWNRLLFLFCALFIYRLGAHIPIPSINLNQLTQLFEKNQNNILGMFNMFSGGALSHLTIFSLGIMPYISSSIIMQLLSSILPKFENLKKEGELGKYKIAQYTRFSTLILAILQGSGISLILESQKNLVLNTGIYFYFITILTLVSGTMFLMWLSEQITEYGLGNGTSIIIFSGIISSLPNTLINLIKLVKIDLINVLLVILISLLLLIMTYFVVFIECGQRKILINYIRKEVNNRIYSNKSSYLPLKLNIAGVIPAIFASSIILFPITIISWFISFANKNNFFIIFLKNLINLISPGKLLHSILYTIAIIFFCFFYATLIFNSKETADNLKKSGAFIPGIRPGYQTIRYIDNIIMRLTLSGSIYIAFVCLIPEFFISQFNIPFYFGGTSLLIVVIVTIDFLTQIQNYILSQKYESLFRKVNFKKNIFY
ncbi:protein translocase subunit SecY [Candidatus Profftella armatura (Diaphorina cf. continua)]|uniref:Protein translocase subunit SecY n=1 Tax=Candidatus Profftella armatura (Diaphorina cf. continua) TaxID=2661583 RepID=A0A7R6VZT9_9PROT|nr:preprotein translocase subunit SecY [Candidatus Profftella armatura (Diaphorina cf. continua)]BCG49468.1 protein translocase subunit SecY [Candidatus Profftella armatura (Diaphorina cf. continua)]